MDRNITSNRGFTLVELMVVMLVSAVLALAVGSMLVFGWMGWVRSNESVSSQRDASLAMLMIAKEIRNSSYDDITAGSGIQFNSGVSFQASGLDLIRDDGMKVVDGWLVSGSFVSTKKEDISAVVTSQWVRVAFSLQTSTEVNNYAIEVAPRN